MIYDCRVTILHAALLARTAAVVRHGGHILDRADFQTDRLQRADGGFTAGAGTFDADFDFLQAVGHRLAGGVLRNHLRGVSRAFARALETDAAGGAPADEVALHI